MKKHNKKVILNEKMFKDEHVEEQNLYNIINLECNNNIVALLHDVVEDTDITIDNIKEMGFNDEVCEAISLLTHDKNIPYMDYIKKIKNNPIAKKVKLADLKHNSDLTRFDVVTEKDIKRIDKYKQAIEYLRGF